MPFESSCGVFVRFASFRCFWAFLCGYHWILTLFFRSISDPTGQARRRESQPRRRRLVAGPGVANGLADYAGQQVEPWVAR